MFLAAVSAEITFNGLLVFASFLYRNSTIMSLITLYTYLSVILSGFLRVVYSTKNPPTPLWIRGLTDF